MSEFLMVLLLAAMPALGNFSGGLLAEWINVSDKTLNLALHFAAGIILAVVGLELMPTALEVEQPWIPIAAFMGGGFTFLLLEKAVHFIKDRFGGEGKATGSAWGIYLGVAIDLFSDGIMIGTGSTVSVSLGLLLALGQVPADIPEGFATIATFKSKGVPEKMRYLLAAGFTIPILLGATIGFWTMRNSGDLIKFSLLAFTAGILLSVAIEEILTEAHGKPDPAYASVLLTAGFSLFALLTVYLEG
ncbi:ZIP family metal transporter [Gramella sp. KN1008]|uniref:ZIP family metal transporter n=1 Tax=Gramella sp. KN1008 TaxID=2529298 RepID=UPI00103E8E7E|nr:ZIP family metal transporter [Gramella sp. KN1008]TBW26979.1 ZIP family zinc transporter [Gramella sp. KN1008]